MEKIFYYPGWTRKAITFTIDDGNVPLDRKFLDITEPAGLKGTFNLCPPLKWLKTAEEYREFYQGYEISNHCFYHPHAMTESNAREIKNELFDPATADEKYNYLTENKGMYKYKAPHAWCNLADDDTYILCVDAAQKKLEEVFGEGKIHGYVWPYCEQKNEKVKADVFGYGFQSVRTTGCLEDKTGFALPENRMAWSYNANYVDLLDVAEKFEKYPDDGELKWMCFGVHSHDFENAGRWDVLEDFCRKYGNRTSEFWYASVGEILDYEDAAKEVIVEDDKITNPTEITLYAELDGKRMTLRPHRTVKR